MPEHHIIILQIGPANPIIAWTIALAAIALIFPVIIRYYVKGSPQFIPSFVKLTYDYRRILEKHALYYQRLSPENKRKFVERVYIFIRSKTFIPRRFKKVTLEMKTLIAASAVQLTFGFEKFEMPHFKKILIYPDAYYSLIRKTYHKGEVNPAARLVVFSWKSFIEGYLNPSDSKNLGLHEMAHVLKLENKVLKNEVAFLDPDLYKEWETMAAQHIARLKKGPDLLFRRYAAENEYEFFAVAIEIFFERPFSLRAIHPEIYSLLKGLLKQDPILIQQLESEESLIAESEVV